MNATAALVWFRQDLRLDDNPALLAALERGGPVVPVFLWAPEEEAPWAPASASRWWLHHSLHALDADLKRLGSRLIVRQGPTRELLDRLISETGTNAVYWNQRYEPAVRARDALIQKELQERGVHVESHAATLLFEPDELRTQQGRPFRVFTPFWKAVRAHAAPASPQAAPRRLPPVPAKIVSSPLDMLGLLPTIDWASGFRAVWTPGAGGARQRLTDFLRAAVLDYAGGRDRPAEDGTSSLSPHLHFGEISPRTVWHALHEQFGAPQAQGPETYLKEVVWRDFAYQLLYHQPQTTDAPLRPEFARFPWSVDRHLLRAWQRGRTGYPLVDAGMRQLWTTGWMHNRMRMVTASFLVKHLLLPWLEGARWFWDTLVDADLANNTFGWQWIAGCGADAAPYFRIFNPVSQGRKFDPQGEYVRRWVPELAALPTNYVHRPWLAPPAVLAQAGVVLDRTYPAPVVDHRTARARALAAFATLRTNDAANAADS